MSRTFLTEKWLLCRLKSRLFPNTLLVSLFCSSVTVTQRKPDSGMTKHIIKTLFIFPRFFGISNGRAISFPCIFTFGGKLKNIFPIVVWCRQCWVNHTCCVVWRVEVSPRVSFSISAFQMLEKSKPGVSNVKKPVLHVTVH